MKKTPKRSAAGQKSAAKSATSSKKNNRQPVDPDTQFSPFYDQVGAPLFTIVVESRNQLRLIAANRCFLSASGMRRAQLIGKKLQEFIPEPSCSRIVKMCREAVRSVRPVSWEETYVHPLETKYGEISVTPVVDKTGRVTHLTGIVNDVTQRKRSEMALHDSEERYRRIVQTAEEGIWSIDVRSLTDYVNPKMAQMMGYEASEMIGRPIDDFLDDEGRALLTGHIRRRKKGVSEQFEFKYVRKDGSYLWAFVSTNPITDSSGAYVGAIALLTDVTARRKAEAEMRESEALFRVIFEQAAVGVTLTDSTTGRFLRVNQRACDIARLTRHQMLSSTFMDITHPDDLQLNLDNMKKLRAGEISTFSMEKRYLHPDGDITWVNITVSPMWKPGEPPARLIAVVEDIGERKKAQLALARTSDLLERTGEMAKIGGWDLDLATMKLFWSQETCRLFQVDHLAAPSVDEAIHFYAPEAQPIIRAALEHAIEYGTSYELELPVISAKGRPFWALSQGSAVKTDGKVTALIGTFQDITRRKQAEKELLESETRLRAFFEQASVGVGILDGQTGRFLELNQRYCTITGRTRRQLLVSTFDQITHPDDRAANMHLKQRLSAGEISEYSLEKRYLLPDGSVIWGNVRVTRIASEGVHTGQHLSVVEDITERKKAEANYLREQEFNQILVNHTSVIIVLLDHEGHMVHVNDATVNILGYSRNELLNRTPWEVGIMRDAEITRARERLVRLFSGEYNPPREAVLYAKNGRTHTVALSSIATRSKDGAIDRIIVTGTDLTERNRLQNEILRISEQEQARIGHNLHDGVGQTMTGVATLMEALESELRGDQKASASRILQLLQEAIQEVRRMSHSLSPASVKNRGLGGALQLLAETIRTNHRTHCTCEVQSDICIDDPERETHIYRIAQEAANNALRHGRPKSIRISFKRLDELQCELKVEDNGSGLLKRNEGSQGIGMRVMDYRANLIGGSLEIKSKPRGGVCVICQFPCGVCHSNQSQGKRESPSMTDHGIGGGI
ncbi:PAS domain S-box protein [Prosthecobacter sp.]|uniref:PAS domain S-box protein n=1 Tax=Prosthecobacter sp. TaxID=1965333 RepID=UPI001D8658ED|nr:PAS domain S-box protein [Prosthecobacter sp.]MCB1278816.1 PAS domain S-box protein [Prosthecobacter sp.]